MYPTYTVVFVVALFVICCGASVTPARSYHGAQVWRTALRSSDDADVIEQLNDNDDIELWHMQSDRADYLVPMLEQVKVHKRLKSSTLNHTVMIVDVQKRVDAQKINPELWTDASLRLGHRMDFQTYPTLKVIDEYLSSLVENFPSLCKVRTIGKSALNKPIKMLQITNGNPANEVVVLLSGAHAREWSAITSNLYVANNIVNKFEDQPSFMKNKKWYIIPVLNPDGFDFTQTTDRLWRKNRRKGSNCIGVDINRNFDIDWNLKQREKNECKITFGGNSAFSEPESRTLRDLILNLNPKPSAYLDLHTYGQYIVYPWSARAHESADKDVHKKIAAGMANSMLNATGKTFKHGATYHIMYPATGAAMDWVYSTGVKRSFVIEGRDQGQHGFLLPPEYIESAGKDILAAVRYLAASIDTADAHNKSWKSPQLYY